MSRSLLVLVAVGFLLLPVPALGHGDLQGMSPEDGAKLGKAPREIRVTLTEAPTRGPQARVTDGCKRPVSGRASVDGNDIVIALRDGEPGKWNVSYRAISSVDGHQTRGKLDFTVRGTKDCTLDEPEDEIDAGDSPGIIENPNPPDEGSNAWIIWLVGGTVAVAGLAFFVRRSSE